ncbi:MAG: hypothetical protein SFW09_02505 [Hyphomicrobiaceae bacterium]|nr:hypothetical protein [Hyphomicrobiaceae bacterium]
MRRASFDAGLWHRTGRVPSLAVSLLMALLGGCGLSAGTVGTSTGTIGDDSSGGASRHYTFARGRVPVSIEGTVAERPRHRQLRVSVAIGAPKYAIDGAVRVRIAANPDDRFKAEIGPRFLLERVFAVAVSGDAAPLALGSRAGIEDLPAVLSNALPPPPVSALERSASTTVQPFKLETEVDPAVPQEVEALQRALAEHAKGWGIEVGFAPVPVEVEVLGLRMALAPNPGARCAHPVCFRLPIPYRLRVEPVTGSWRGKAEAITWLPNEGPIGAIDVRDPAFAFSDARATFDNGMLRSLTSRQPGTAASLMRLPASSSTANAARR